MPRQASEAPARPPDTRRRLRRIESVLDRRQPDLTVLMERVNKPHNFSAILRNCDAVGVSDAHVVPPDRGLPLHEGTSAGTAKWIRVHRYADGLDAVRVLRETGHNIVAADPGRGSVDFRAVDYVRPTAIVVGAELYGISGEVRDAADVRVRIPMAGMARSLNVSVATALLLYEAQRQRYGAGSYDESRVIGDERSRLIFEWMYPKVARRLKAAGRPYPALEEDGSLPPGPVTD